MYSRRFEFQSPFHGISLQDVLQKKSQVMQAALVAGVPRVLAHPLDEDAYIQQVIGEYCVTIPQLDCTPEHIKKTEEYEEIPGTQLSGEVVFPDRRYRVWVVTFRIPFTGEVELLQYVPQGGAPLSHPDAVFISDGHVCFKARTLDRPEKDLQQMKAQKDKTITFLQSRLAAITPELEQYNQGVASSVPVLFASLKQKYQQDKEVLDQL